jgi:predicted Zn-dependent protease
MGNQRSRSATWVGRVALVLVGAAMGAAGGCTSTLRTQTETAATNVLIPPEEEAQLGQQIQAELSKQVKFVSDPSVKSYVDGLTQRVFQAAKSDDPNLSVAVEVIDDPKTVNAFATPGSRLYVYTGLLLAAHDEAELACVLGHETGHIIAKHPERQMVDQYGLSAISAAVLGKNAPMLANLGASVASQGYLLANSRADETEADEMGARFASHAGYDPHALGQFLQRISGGQPPGVMVFLSDHPTTPNRVSHLETFIAKNALTGQRGDTAQLAAVQQKLQSAIGGGPQTAPSPPPAPSPQTTPSPR